MPRRNSAFMSTAAAAGGSAAVVTLSNETAVDVDGPTTRTYTAGMRYNLDGTMDGRVINSYAQRNASTDWIIPNSASEDEDYEIRFTNYTGFGPTFAFGVEDIWEDLDGGKEIRISQSLGPFDSQLAQFTIEIRINGGAVIDSALITLDIENFGF